MSRTNALLLTLVALLMVVSVVLGDRFADSGRARFQGSDSRAQDLVGELAPRYSPWFRLPFAPPSTEVESALFALQAALGAGFIGYYIGLRSGSKRSGGVSDED